ncbi:GSCOCG00006095001-RA-CDS [Cotesia congregata]|nr:GSCOCG00006095001-RA-CDS [Cotesia congregata]
MGLSKETTATIDFDDPKYRIKPYQQMIASCTGALVTSVFVTPLDVVKTRLQAQQKAMLSNKCFVYCNGLMDHLCPCNGKLPTWMRENGKFTGTVDYYNRNSNKHRIHQTQPFWIPIVAGATARIWAATLVSPLELIRTKMQSQKLSYREIGEGLKTVVKYGGISGLWMGLSSTLFRDVPFSAIYWCGYEAIKKLLPPEQHTFSFNFTAGALAGSIAAFLTIPFDVVKTHQQIEMGEKRIYTEKPRKNNSSSFTNIVKRIYQQNGIQGLFTGLTPRIIKVAPACAIMIASFEHGKRFFLQYNRALAYQQEHHHPQKHR